MRIPLPLILLVVAGSIPLAAEQPERAAEVYGLTGSYRFGNRSNVLKGGEWNPQAGVGFLVPVRSRWAVLTDFVTSLLERNEVFTDSRDSEWAYPVILRGGLLVGPTQRLVLRGGYLYIGGYFIRTMHTILKWHAEAIKRLSEKE